MADISEYISEMKNAPTGKEFRKPLANAISAINEHGKNIQTLEGHHADEFASYKKFSSMLPLDLVPQPDSRKLVTGGGIYAVLGDLNIDWSDIEWPT